MATIPVKYRAPIWAVAINLIVVLGLPPAAWAAMAVTDNAALAKLSAQVTKLQEQLDTMNKIKDGVQDQIDAVGKMGKITLPTIDLERLGRTILRDLQCLKPDFSKLMPEINFEEMEFNSVCEGAPIYRKTLWVDPDDLGDMLSWEEQTAAIEVVAARRERVFTDSITKGMAQADVATKDVAHTNAAANELESSLGSAINSKQQLQVIGQGQVAIVRALAKQNQILAQMLKVQSTFALQAGVPVEGLPTVDVDGNDENGGSP